MTAQQIVGLAVRLLAVWLALTALSYGMSAFSYAQSAQESGTLASPDLAKAAMRYYGISAAMYFAGAFLLWFFPLAIAHRLIPRTRFQDTLRLPVQQTVAIACVVLGLVAIVLKALPALSSYLGLAAFWIANGERISVMPANQHIDGFSGLMQLAAGLFLIVKARTLAAKLMPSLDAASAPAQTPPQDALAKQAKPESESTAGTDAATK